MFLAVAEIQERVLAAKCIQTNTLLSAPLEGIIDRLGGALGGFLLVLVGFVAVGLAVGAVITIMSKKSSQFLKAILVVLMIPLALIIAMIVYNGLIIGLNNAC